MNKNRKNRVEYLPYKGLVDLRLYVLDDKEFYAFWHVQENYVDSLKFLKNMKKMKSFDEYEQAVAQEKAQYEKAMEFLGGKEIKTPELL